MTDTIPGTLKVPPPFQTQAWTEHNQRNPKICFIVKPDTLGRNRVQSIPKMRNTGKPAVRSSQAGCLSSHGSVEGRLTQGGGGGAAE